MITHRIGKLGDDFIDTTKQHWCIKDDECIECQDEELIEEHEHDAD